MIEHVEKILVKRWGSWLLVPFVYGFFFLQLQQVVQIFVESEANSVGSSTSVGSIHGHQTLIYCTAIKYDKDMAFKDAYGLLGW